MTSEDLPHLELGYNSEKTQQFFLVFVDHDEWTVERSHKSHGFMCHPSTVLVIIIHGLSDYQVCFLKRCNPEKLSLFF